MKFLREIIGLLFIIVAWSGVFGVNFELQVLFFILGFDFMSLIPKIIVFVFDFFFELSDVGWILLLLVVVEAAVHLFGLKPIFSYILKPLAVFMILYVNGIGVVIAFIVAGLDLLLNVSKKYI